MKKKRLIAVGGAWEEPGCGRFKVTPGRFANMQVLLLKDGIFWYTDNKKQTFFEDKIGDRLRKIPILTIVTVAASGTKI